MKKHLLLLVLALLPLLAQANYVKNKPTCYVQPNGDTVRCFVSGDEIYHRLHDAQGFTLVRDTTTGYLVYATLDASGELVPTAYIAGSVDPASVGLTPGLTVSKRELERLAALWPQPEPSSKDVDPNRNRGTMNNLVIFVGFADDSIQRPYSHFVASYDTLHDYFLEASYNQLTVNSHFYPAPNGNQVVCFRYNAPRSYYINASLNTRSYIITSVINQLNQQALVDPSLNLDMDNDGEVDNITFLISGESGEWSSFFWSCKSSLGSNTNLSINGKRVNNFNWVMEDQADASTMCHEFTHTLGAPDLYTGSGNTDAVGSWDLMASNQTPPQQLLSHIKQRYCNWIDSIPTLTQPGTYTLYPLADTGARRAGRPLCYRIPLDGNQSYVLEYRRTGQNDFDYATEGTGLLVYLTDSRFFGNKNTYGQGFEVWVMRPYSNNFFEFGEIWNAALNDQECRSQFPSNTHSAWYNGSNLHNPITLNNVNIYNVQMLGDSLVFTYGPQPLPEPDMQFPLSEDFEGGRECLPESWYTDILEYEWTGNSRVWVEAYQDGSHKMIIPDSNILVLPRLPQDINMSDIQFSFSMHSSYPNESGIVVGVCTTNGSGDARSHFTPIDTILYTGPVSLYLDTMVRYLTYFDQYTGSGRYIALRGYNRHWVLLDDLSIDYAPACRPARDLAIADTTPTSLTIAWRTNGSTAQWEVCCTTGNAPTQGTLIPGSSSSHTFQSLTPGAYRCFVRPVSGTGEACEWVATESIRIGPKHVITPNETVSLHTCNSWILAESFHDDIPLYGSHQTATITIYPSSPNHCVQLTGQYRLSSLSIFAGDTLAIYNGTSTSAPCLTRIVSHNIYDLEGNLNLLAENPQGALTIQFSTRNYPIYGKLLLYAECIDNSCPRVLNPQSTGRTRNSADLAWDGDTSGFWEIEYGPAGFAHGSGTTMQTTTNPVTIAGLTPLQNYDFYIRTLCGGASVSRWSQKLSVRPYTECSDPTATAIGQYTNAIGDWTGSYNNYYLSASIYDSANLAPIPGIITGIAIYPINDGNGQCMDDYDIYMANTTRTHFAHDSDYVNVDSTFIHVYHGNLNHTSGTNRFAFQNPFLWDGHSNVIVIFVRNTGRSGPQNASTFRYIYSTTNKNYSFDSNHSRIDPTDQGASLAENRIHISCRNYRPYFSLLSCPRDYIVGLAASPAQGGTASGGGLYEDGSTATLTATPAQGYRFLGWSDGATQSPRQLTVTSDTTLTALFQLIPQYTLTLLAEPAEGGTVSGGGTYLEGTTATLTATPAQGYRFLSWSDGATQSPRQLTVTSDTTITALFEPIPQYTITLQAEPAEGGTVSGGGTYLEGTTATLTATPAAGYRFLRWHDNNTSNPRNVTVTADATYTARFAPTQSIAEVSPEAITLHPNPATTSVTVEGFEGEVQVVDLQGRVVQSFTNHSPLTTHHLQLPAGTYFVRCGNAVQKLIVK